MLPAVMKWYRCLDRCEAVRLYTGTSAQIFSVRLRDKGPDYRGFVQVLFLLPSISYCGRSYQQWKALAWVKASMEKQRCWFTQLRSVV